MDVVWIQMRLAPFTPNNNLNHASPFKLGLVRRHGPLTGIPPGAYSPTTVCPHVSIDDFADGVMSLDASEISKEWNHSPIGYSHERPLQKIVCGCLSVTASPSRGIRPAHQPHRTFELLWIVGGNRNLRHPGSSYINTGAIKLPARNRLNPPLGGRLNDTTTTSRS